MKSESLNPDILEFFNTQLDLWPMAKDNFSSLDKVKVKEFKNFPFNLKICYNPERVRSTKADVSEKGIKNRECFLCKKNRPENQLVMSLFENWDILVNPYPIFPYHFTIASKTHSPQNFNFPDLYELCTFFKGMVVFFNGAQSGASAPDHLHLQAVPASCLPLIEYIERKISLEDIQTKSLIKEISPYVLYAGAFQLSTISQKSGKLNEFENNSKDFSLDLSFFIQDLNLDSKKLNAFFWIDSNGLFKFIIIPRKAHRPSCFYKDLSEGGFLISPGAVDMAGVTVLPRLSDFENIDLENLKKVYEEVAFTEF